jgi:hypothetical protein
MGSMKKVVEICGATCPNEDGGPDYVCQRPKHKLYPSAKHWEGGVSWTQGGADRIATELAAKKETKFAVNGNGRKRKGGDGKRYRESAY